MKDSTSYVLGTKTFSYFLVSKVGICTKTSIPWFAIFWKEILATGFSGDNMHCGEWSIILGSCLQRGLNASPLPHSLKFVFSVGKTEADMHCSMKCPGRPPLVSFFWRPPYVTFWYQTSFWCNYWGLTLTLQSGNVIPFPVHHCILHCMLMALQSKHKAFFYCVFAP